MKLKYSQFIWGGLVMVLSLALTLFVTIREKLFAEATQVTSPDISLGPILAYFFGVVVVLGLALFLIPVSKFKIIFRLLFGFMFGWGTFIIFALTAPLPLAYALAAVAAIVWLFWARVWLHDLLLIMALAAAASVFGFLLSPWTFIAFMLIVSVYDVVAVRFGYMVWMAERLSETDTFPGFILPKQITSWNLSLEKARVGDLRKEAPDQREHTILGGGDIGFPLMLAVSTYFAAGLASAVTVGVFALAGLMGAFLIQLRWLKGKPMPALPPIAFAAIAGFLIATAVFK